MRALCDEVTVAVVRRSAAGSDAMQTEFAIPFFNSWVVVLDGRGETLARWIGDSAGAGCDERSADKFAENLVELIRKGLKRTESVQELERRWRSHPNNTKKLDVL